LAISIKIFHSALTRCSKPVTVDGIHHGVTAPLPMSLSKPDFSKLAGRAGFCIGDYDNHGFDDDFVTSLGPARSLPQPWRWHLYAFFSLGYGDLVSR
jgi:hypothetical protein